MSNASLSAKSIGALKLLTLPTGMLNPHQPMMLKAISGFGVEGFITALQSAFDMLTLLL